MNGDLTGKRIEKLVNVSKQITDLLLKNELTYDEIRWVILSFRGDIQDRL
jgi:uncharacterized protein YeeX (DUF496 family)